MNEDQVCIPREELEELRRDSRFLSCLYDAGVDNWEGFEEAIERNNGFD